MLEVVNGYPGLRRDVQTYLKERIREVLTGSSDAIVVRIYGDDLKMLKDLAEEVEDKLDGIEGIVDLHTEQLVEHPADPGHGRPGQGAAVRRQAGRCPADRVDLHGRRGGR